MARWIAVFRFDLFFFFCVIVAYLPRDADEPRRLLFETLKTKTDTLIPLLVILDNVGLLRHVHAVQELRIELA